MKKIIKLTLVILCMVLIFCFSSDDARASTKKSDGIIIKTCELVLGRELIEEEKVKYIADFVFPCGANDKVRTDKGHRRPFALSLVRILRSANVYSADDFACGVQHREQKGPTARKSVVFFIFARRDIASSDIHK